MIKHVESVNEFKSLVSKGTVLVDFYADWCGPCQMLAPVIEELDKSEQLTILKVDVDELSDLAREFRVMSIPTLMVFKDGKLAKREMGYMPLEALKRLVA